jgi:hypothetical protein
MFLDLIYTVIRTQFVLRVESVNPYMPLTRGQIAFAFQSNKPTRAERAPIARLFERWAVEFRPST